MLGFFRRIIKSPIGVVIGLLFLGAIALSFAAGDIQNLMQGGGVSSETAATVGGEKLVTTTVEARTQRVFEVNRRNQPNLTIGQFLDAGGSEEVFRQLVDGLAISEFGRDNGMRIGKKLVDAEIAGIPAFQDATGKFSQRTFNEMLQRERIPEKDLRDDIARQILEKQLLGPAGLGARTPKGMINPYASMLLEKRTGSVAILPAAAFLPTTKPDEATLKRYYAANGDRFALPEQRRVRYAVIDIARFAGKTAPSEAEITQYFKANAAQYAASEKRSVHQLILPTEAAAKGVAAKVSPGLTLEKAASGAGLAASVLPALSRRDLAAQTSDAAAGQIFGAARGALVGPVKTGLGWALYSVADIQATGARGLDAVRQEIVTKLSEDKTKQALADMANKIDGQIGDGATFDEIVKSNGLTSVESAAVTAQGQSITDPSKHIDAALLPVVTAGFTMEQGDDPQVVTLQPDKQAAIVSLAQILPSGPPALAQVRADVEKAYLLSQGAAKAKAAAEALHKKVVGGMPIPAAVASAGVKLPAPERIGAQRSELGGQNGQIPPSMIALFSMKRGTSRLLPLPAGQGYIVMRLDEIIPGDASKNAQILTATGEGLAGVLSDEYARQFMNAVRANVGVKRNDAALARVSADLRKGGVQQ